MVRSVGMVQQKNGNVKIIFALFHFFDEIHMAHCCRKKKGKAPHEG